MEKTILITGCSSGIGLCAAQTLKNRGYRVFATARKIQDVQKLNDLGLESLLLDVDNTQSIENALDQILTRTQGQLDALFNNSGFGIPGAIEDLNRDTIRKQFETNVFGPMELIKYILPIMHQQGHGRIIQNCSMLGIVALPFRGAYNASKFALEGFSNTLRVELRGTPIHVSILEPGPIISHFRNNAFENYKTHLASQPSQYDEVYKNMATEINQQASKKLPFAKSPEAVVKKLIHALESRRPKAHYYIGFPSHLFAILRRILPDVALDWVIATSCKQEMQWQAKQRK